MQICFSIENNDKNNDKNMLPSWHQILTWVTRENDSHVQKSDSPVQNGDNKQHRDRQPALTVIKFLMEQRQHVGEKSIRGHRP